MILILMILITFTHLPRVVVELCKPDQGRVSILMGITTLRTGGLVLTEMIIISLSFKLFSLPRKVVTTFSDVTARMIMPRSGWILIGMVLLRKMEISAVRN